MQLVKDRTATLGFHPAKTYPVCTHGQAGQLTASFGRTGSQDVVPLGGQGQERPFRKKVNRGQASFPCLQPESPGTPKSRESYDNRHHNSFDNCFGSEFFGNLWTGTHGCQENTAARMELQP